MFACVVIFLLLQFWPCVAKLLWEVKELSLTLKVNMKCFFLSKRCIFVHLFAPATVILLATTYKSKDIKIKTEKVNSIVKKRIYIRLYSIVYNMFIKLKSEIQKCLNISSANEIVIIYTVHGTFCTQKAVAYQ